MNEANAITSNDKPSGQVVSSSIISRHRLLRLLEDAADIQCHSFVAPSGFGKTTLMVDWLKRSEMKAVWITIRSSDNSPHQFWTRFIDAFVEQGYRTEAWQALLEGARDDIGSDEWLERLGLELANSAPDHTAPTALVLDDLHHLENPAISGALARGVRFLPAHISLYVLSRSTPPKGLCSYAPGSRYLQLGADDLAFSLEEGKQYLQALQANRILETTSANFQHHLNSPLVKIWQKSEGWPVFFCAMANRWVSKAITTAALDSTPAHDECHDYIEEQILNKLSSGVREVLAQLAPLTCFNRALVNQCLFPGESPETLQQLFEQKGLFVSYPTANGFYRIREPLREYLKSKFDWQIIGKTLSNFEKAFKWYLANDATYEAVSLCVDNSYWLSAVHMIETQYRHFAKSCRWQEIGSWLEQIPEHIVKQRPLLLMLQARKSLFNCAPTKAIASLNQAQKLLSEDGRQIDHPDNLYRNSAKKAQLQEIATLIASTHALYTSHHQPLEALDVDKSHHPDGGSLLLEYQAALALLYRNRLNDAKLALSQVLEQAITNNDGVLLQTVSALGWTHYLLGEFEQWQNTITWLTSLLAEHEETHGCCPWLGTTIALSCLETGALDKSEFLLSKAPCTHYPGVPRDMVFRLMLKRVMLKLRLDQLDEAEAILAEAEILSHELPEIVQQSYLSVNALRAELLQKRGNAEEALHLLEARDQDPGDCCMARQHERLVAAEILFELGQSQASLDYYQKVAQWAESCDCKPLLLRAHIGKALIYEQKNQSEKASRTFHDALRLGRAMDSIISFQKSTPEMKRLLSNAKSSTRYPYYVGKLIDITGEDQTESAEEDINLSSLSKREKQILDLLAMGMSNPEIAQNLRRSLGTVKIHVHNIYRKLGASNRVTAINKYLNATGSNAA